MKNHETQGEYFTRPPVRKAEIAPAFLPPGLGGAPCTANRARCLGCGVRDFAAGVLNALANVDILDI